MALHNLRGAAGERLAENYLQKLGYAVQHRNWRTSFYEIDVIAVRDEILHFIEVKTRHSLRYGYPEEDVTKKKFKNMQKAAEYFLRLHPYWKRIQYDILAITCLPGRPIEYFLLEDVFL